LICSTSPSGTLRKGHYDVAVELMSKIDSLKNKVE